MITRAEIDQAVERLTLAIDEFHDSKFALQDQEDLIWFGCKDPKEIGSNAEIRDAYIRKECRAAVERYRAATIEIEQARARWQAVQLVAENEQGIG